MAYETGHGTIANAGKHPLAAVLGWLFMLQNLNAGLNVPVVTWTLSYEMVFYLLLAGLFSWGVPPAQRLVRDGLRGGRGGARRRAADVGARPLVEWPGAGPACAQRGHRRADPRRPGARRASRSWLVKGGASLAALVALVLLTFNQSYPYPWSGCVILALMFTGTLIYRAER